MPNNSPQVSFNEQLLQSVSEFIKNIGTIKYKGIDWYPASEIRKSFRSYSHGGQHSRCLRKQEPLGLARKFKVGNQAKWYVKAEAIRSILFIQKHHIECVAFVLLIEKGGSK